MNEGKSVMLPFNQETFKKSAKEENKESFSIPLSSKKEMNVGTNNMLPSNQETVKKSAKEENKKSLSTCLLSKKKSKKEKEKEKIFIISKKKRKKIEKIMAKQKRRHYITGNHNKFAYDNMTRKLKAHLFESILVLLNASLREDEDENIKKNSKKRIVTGPFFVKINQKIIRKTTVKHNQKLLSKQIKVIFSKKVGERYKKYNSEILIDKIYKEKKKKKLLIFLKQLS